MSTSELINTTKHLFYRKWSVSIKVAPIVIAVILLKLAARHFDYEVLELNALFTSLVAGTIFLLGFLISGIMSDFKESEKIPSELASSLKSILDDIYCISRMKESSAANEFMLYHKDLIRSAILWFYRKEKTKNMLEKISSINEYIIQLDREGIAPAYLVRIKTEQSNLRKMILRIDTIRDTEFIGSAYAIVEAMGLVIAIGLIIMKIEPFYASMFFTIFVTYLIFYMFLLMKDVDNPFDYSDETHHGTEVSLKPLQDLIDSLEN